jgi:uncharacterized membrane protein YfcA
LSFLAAFILGLTKSGLKGIGILAVTLLALLYGAKASTGIVLPLLIFADILAVWYYNRHVRWVYLLQFLPWMVGGVLVAVFFGKNMPEEHFKNGMAIIILVSVIMMFWWERYDKSNVPDKIWFAGSTGFLAGFTTMIGNLAGAFANIFFLATRIPKNEFIGTAAWLFFIINIFKLPFHIFSWETVTRTSIMTDLYLVPGVAIGFVVGLRFVKWFKEHHYRIFILAMTAIGALVMLIK